MVNIVPSIDAAGTTAGDGSPDEIPIEAAAAPLACRLRDVVSASDSQFEIRLLNSIATLLPSLAPFAGQAAAAPAPRSLLVLVVDDVRMNREIADSFLRAAGHEVTCVEGGVEAVAAVANADFDVILMDVRLPGMDGYEARASRLA